MKLYSYDHCPYCVKARMIFGLKGVPFELQTLLNDDEETPISLIGQKMLPILIKDDGVAMPESLDIVQYIDHLKEYGAPIVGPARKDEFLDRWLQEMRAYHYALAMPRWVKMDLVEFQTQGAIDYFTNKKEKSIGPFAEAMARTPQLIAQAHDHLGKLEEWFNPSPYVWGSELSVDDFHLFASLRCLTMVDGLKFPEKIHQYTQQLSQKSGVALYWDHKL